MSYQKRTVTVCDFCSDFEWGQEEKWKVGHRYTDEGREPVHLCPDCRETVWYCHDCQDFHPFGEACLPGPE